MRDLVKVVLAALAASALLAQPAAARSRIKDIVFVEGIRENQLTGTGLVMGLNGTGDNLRNSPQAKQALQAMLERQGVNIRDANIDVKNVAFVNITATLPAFATPGSRIDVTVATTGDAKSLVGGQLVVSALQGADGEVYAVAQGTVETGAIAASGGSGSSVLRGVPTTGRIAGGATVEKEVEFSFASLVKIHLNLRNPDFATSQRIANAVNARFPGAALAENPGVVTVIPPKGMSNMDFMTAIEQLDVEPDNVAKVTIDEASGLVVIGQDVRISTVAIQQGNLTISIQETPQVSQPSPFSQGQTTVTTKSDVKVDEEKGKKLIVLKSGASLASLVKGLNALGVTPRDMIQILQGIKRQGALQADIVVM